jgi:hypothetical protein
MEVFQPHQQRADALAGGVKDRVADRRVGTDIASSPRPSKKLATLVEEWRVFL